MASPVHPGDILADKYVVDRVLGEGGMALVVAARHLQLHQTVAIKLMRSRALAFPDAVDRFIREAQTVVRLRSENVARVMDVGMLDDGTPFMVMEHLEGVDLATVLNHHGALAVEDAVDYVLQACTAMAEAHEAGIIHRDLKPSNLFLTRRPTGVPLIKVLDFGISKARPSNVDGGVLETGNFGTMGSPPYMSPEQARSARHVDERSDIWSLGVILYHLTSARLPFFATSAAEVLAEILYQEPERLHQVAPWVPRAFSRVVMRCLEKEPGARYASVSELTCALARFASPEGRLLVDAALVPARRSTSSASLAAQPDPDLDGEDTAVDPAASKVRVQEPRRLELAHLFEVLPARALDDAYPRTTYILSSGELSGGRLGRVGRRAFLAVAGLATAGLAAAAIGFFTGGSVRPATRNAEDSPGLPAAGTAAGQSTAPAAGTASAPDAALAEDTETASAQKDEPADHEGAPAAHASPDAASDPDAVAADEADPGGVAPAPPTRAAGSSARSKAQKARSKRRKTRRPARKKPARTGNARSKDPFGTIR